MIQAEKVQGGYLGIAGLPILVCRDGMIALSKTLGIFLMIVDLRDVGLDFSWQTYYTAAIW